MPEMPEVRVVAKTLKKSLIGRRIIQVKALYPRIIDGNVYKFITTLKDSTFTDIKTCGKWLIFELGEYSFLSHLRMEGKYFYVSHDEEVSKHTHVIFELDNGMDLRYNDVRKFGRMELVKTSEVYDNPSIKKLGYEPGDKKLTPEYLLEKFSSSSLPIKSILLDQSIINGLGNIYANEVLFASEISPFREAKSISKKEAEEIILHSKEITDKAFSLGGSTIRSYTSSLGVIGHYQDYLKVHGKAGEKCPRCKNGTIVKASIGGRGTYYCDSCQK